MAAVEGKLQLTEFEGDAGMELARGQSAAVPAGVSQYRITGSGRVYKAAVNLPEGN